MALRLDVVTGLEGLEDEEHNAAGEVLQRAAESHTDGHTSSRQKGCDAGGVDAQGADGYGDEQYPQDHSDETVGESYEGGVVPFSLQQALVDPLADGLDEPGAYYEDGKCGKQLQPEADGCLHQGVQDLVGRLAVEG